MATAGNVVVSLIARTEAFTRGMSKSRRSLRALEKTTIATTRTIKRMGVVAAAAAIGGLTVLTKRSLATIDATGKLANRIGVSTEFLTAYGHAASLAGTSTEEFQKSMEIFVRRLGEVTMGSGEAKQGLEAIGLTLAEVINLNPEQSFLKVANGIKGLSTQAEKAAAAYKFFGRSGSKMLNLLDGNLDGVVEKMRELNILFSQEDYLRVAAANDAINDMNKAFEGVGNTLAIAVAPMLEEIANRITDIAVGQNSVEQIQKRIERTALAATVLADVFLIVKGVFKGIIGLAEKLLQLNMHILSTLLKIASAMASALKLEGLSDNINTVANAFGELSEHFGETAAKNLGESMKSFMEFGEARESLEKFFKEVNEKAAKAITPVAKVAADTEGEDRFDKLSKAAESLKKSLRGPVEIFKDLRNEYKEMLDLGLITTEQFDKAVRKAGKGLMATPEAFDAGRFEQVRTDLIDVAGLSSAANNPQLAASKLNNAQNQQIIEELQKLNQKEVLA